MATDRDAESARWTEGPAVSGPTLEAGDERWAQRQLDRLLQASLREQRRARRWGILFKSLFLVYLVGVTWLIVADDYQPEVPGTGRHTALVDLDGIIASGTDAAADVVTGGLRAAFEDPNTSGVILRINSPGGSPVQSRLIYDEIRRLRDKHANVPLYAVITDVGASGGYYVAAAADRIYADRASVVGSIGVRMDGFGFTEAIDRLGIERRLLTAGEDKGLLDPFQPAEAEQVAHVQALLDRIHAQFVEAVRAGRGDRLAEGRELFSGLIWTGEEGVELGLVDALGSPGYVAREVIGQEEVVDFTRQRRFWERVVDRLGASIADALVGSGLPALR